MSSLFLFEHTHTHSSTPEFETSVERTRRKRANAKDVCIPPDLGALSAAGKKKEEDASLNKARDAQASVALALLRRVLDNLLYALFIPD